MKRTLLSIGHGYSARALSRRLLSDGWHIFGTTRSEEKAAQLKAEGVDPLIWPGSPLPFEKATHLLTSIAPDGDGDPVLREVGTELRQASHLKWVGYLSTTGVYGDHDGNWVDETTAPDPSTKRGTARVQAEAEWKALGLPMHIFRLAGIYGPGRSPFEKIRRGTARRIIKDGQVFSRIHVEDIAQVLAASLRNPTPGRVFNVCDDHPAPPQDVIAYAAELLCAPIPEAVQYDDADMSPMARSFYAESKRVRNGRIKDELGIRLAFPSYREGLKAVLAEETKRNG